MKAATERAVLLSTTFEGIKKAIITYSSFLICLQLIDKISHKSHKMSFECSRRNRVYIYGSD